jgi:hypothetical protein
VLKQIEDHFGKFDTHVLISWCLSYRQILRYEYWVFCILCLLKRSWRSRKIWLDDRINMLQLIWLLECSVFLIPRNTP